MKRILASCIAIVAMLLSLGIGTDARGQLVIYEGFDYPVGNLNGQAGGTGFDGAWASNVRNGVVRAGSLTWGNLLISGGHGGSNAWSSIYRPISTDLANAGLLNDGATVWFSYVEDIAGQNMTNLWYSFALGTDPFSNDYGTAQEMLNDGEGIGMSNWRYKLYGAYWQDTGDGDGLGDRDYLYTNVDLNATDKSRILVVGKIEWAANPADPDKLTVYLPGQDFDTAGLGTPVIDAWETTALDQSVFDTIAIQWKDSNAAMDELRIGATSADVLPTIQYLNWDNGSTDSTWENATNWDPDVAPGSTTSCTIDNGDTVSLTTTGTALALDLGATAAGTTLNLSGSLTVGPLPLTVGPNGTLNVTGTLSALELNTSGNTTIGATADISAVGTITVNGGTLTAQGTLVPNTLTYNAGTLDLGGNDLNAGSLIVNGDLDLSGSTVSVATSLAVNDATLTLGNDITTQNFTLDGGNVTGGTVTATGNYYFTNVADYTAAITGGRLYIGYDRATDELVKISNPANAFSWTEIRRGVLEANTDAANIGTDRLRFDANNNAHIAVLQTNGLFTRPIGNASGKVYWNNGGGFAAAGGALTVTLERGDGQFLPLDWGNNNNGFNGKNLHLGSPFADSVVTLTNDIDGGGSNRNIYVWGNPNTDADYAVLSGELTNFNILYVRGGSTSPGKLLVANVTANEVRVLQGATLGGSGNIFGQLTVNTGSGVAPGASVGTLTVEDNVTLNTGSFYEWEVGQSGQTDVLHITAGTLNLDDFVLKILDADGFVASDTDPLPVFTYVPGAVTVDMADFGNDADNFDTSALGPSWTIGTLALTDDLAGTIYLTGLSGGTSSAIPGDFNSDAQVEQIDLNLLLANWGASSVPPQWTAPFDGLVDQNELNDLLQNWGAGVPGAEPVGATETVAPLVPEPATLSLLVLSGLMMGRRRR